MALVNQVLTKDVALRQVTDVIANPMVMEYSVWPYRLAVPFLYAAGAYAQSKKWFYGLFDSAPRTNVWVVDGVSVNSSRVRDGAAKWPALDATYNFRYGEGGNPLVRAIDYYWMRVRNAQAVRNRLKIAKNELRAAIDTVSANGEVRILSLAAGTAQGVIEIMATQIAKGVPVKAVLVDSDRSALRYAEALARKHRVEAYVKTIEADVLFFDRFVKDYRPNIVEMMGLTDYLRDSLATKLFRRIRNKLEVGGFFFTCHIHPNHEQYFLKHVVNWDMLYRTPQELETLLIDGGFSQPRLCTEPHRIHSVAVAQKT